MSAPVLDLALRAKFFGATRVLGALRLSIGKGEIVALTGASGIGKTTLLRILAGLDTEFDGTLRRPERTAMVFQEPTLLPWRDARANIRLTTGASADAADRLLAEVGLEGREEALPLQLSLGQRRRLAFARALAAAPEGLAPAALDAPGAVRAAVESLARHPEAAGVYGDCEYIDAAGRPIGATIFRKSRTAATSPNGTPGRLCSEKAKSGATSPPRRG